MTRSRGTRAGVQGSAALYRHLFDRLVSHDNIRNLAWVWQSSEDFGAGTGHSGHFSPDFLHVNALELDTNRIQGRFRGDAFLKRFAAGKPIGLEIDCPIPDPSLFARESQWSWFFLAPQ